MGRTLIFEFYKRVDEIQNEFRKRVDEIQKSEKIAVSVDSLDCVMRSITTEKKDFMVPFIRLNDHADDPLMSLNYDKEWSREELEETFGKEAVDEAFSGKNKALGHRPVPLKYIEITIEVPRTPKCDCGGAKCKLPCLDWCSTRSNK
jgi:hypothetical protein